MKECPECREANNHLVTMKFMNVTCLGNDVELTYFCRTCDCELEFKSIDIDTEYGDNGWSVTHGILWYEIQLARKERRRVAFWKSYRHLRKMSVNEPDKFRQCIRSRDIRRRLNKMMSEQLLSYSQPLSVLNSFAEAKPLPKNKATLVKFRRPTPYKEDK